MSKLPVIDNAYNYHFDREMRAYLIKDEGTFERLAVLKYQEEENCSNKSREGEGAHLIGKVTPNSSLGS